MSRQELTFGATSAVTGAVSKAQERDGNRIRGGATKERSSRSPRADDELISRMRAAKSLDALETSLDEAAAAWGISDYAYTCYTRRIDLSVRFGLRMKRADDAGDGHGRQPPGRSTGRPRFGTLFDLCRHRLAPLIWQSNDEMRRFEILTAPPGDNTRGWCGAAVPVHSPAGDFGVFLVASRCGGFSRCGTARLSLIHAAAIAVHETALRNCSGTRFGLQYETVDASEAATYREQEQNINGVPTVH